jgi:hypothetical protein
LVASGLPELGNSGFVADKHAWARARRELRKEASPRPGRNDVRAEMAERHQPIPVANGGEATQAAPGDIREKHALDRVFVAECEDLVAIRALDQPRHGR